MKSRSCARAQGAVFCWWSYRRNTATSTSSGERSGISIDDFAKFGSALHSRWATGGQKIPDAYENARHLDRVLFAFRFAKPLNWETGFGGLNPPLSVIEAAESRVRPLEAEIPAVSEVDVDRCSDPQETQETASARIRRGQSVGK